MPRFSLSSFDGEEAYSGDNRLMMYSPRQAVDHGDNNSRDGGAPSSSSSSASVRLVCRSLDDRSRHALLRRNGVYVIQSRMNHPEAAADADLTRVDMVETLLPEMMQTVFHREAPCELVCVQGEGELSPSSRHSAALSSSSLDDNDAQTTTTTILRRLCLYSNRSLFVIQIAVSLDTDLPPHEPRRGSIIAIDQPLEHYWLQRANYASKIVRVRAAPQRQAGYAVHSPGRCLAVLVEHADSHEYQLALLEANGLIKVPLTFVTPGIESSEHGIVDFCFAQSKGLPLLATMSLLLVKASGDVLAASPFLFDGTIVPKPAVREVLDFVEATMEATDRSEAQWRRCRVAKQFLHDVFAPDTQDARVHFYTARTAQIGRIHAANFPVQVQGPILFENQSEEIMSLPALTVETFGQDDFVGVCVGRSDNSVDFGIISPTTLLPRFALESTLDKNALDDEAFQCSRWVERVALTEDDERMVGCKSTVMALIQDPASDNLLHVVTPPAVYTISTNAMNSASRVLMGKPSRPTRTTAWTCMSAAEPTTVQGVVVLSDPMNGHCLIAQCSDGSTPTTNINEKRFQHELEALAPPPSEQQSLVPAKADAMLKDLEATEPLYKSLAPLVEQVQAGLAGIGKIVGSATNHEDVAPDQLAVVAAIKERCEKELVEPLLTLRKTMQAREVALESLLKQQERALQSLLQLVGDTAARTEQIRQRLKLAEENAAILKNRSEEALEAAKGIAPNVTQAELDYFDFVQASNDKSIFWEKNVNKLVSKATSQIESLGDECIIVDGLDDKKPLLRQMIDAQEATIGGIRKRFVSTEKAVRVAAMKAGLEPPSENM